MSTQQELVDHFWWFVDERHQIYRRRFELKLPPPWTTDETLRVKRFTNVYRSLDPGTVFIMQWIADNPPASDTDLFWTLSVYRMLNRVETYERHGIPERVEDTIKDWFTAIRTDQDAGISVATGSHCTHIRNILPWLLDWTNDSITAPVVTKATASPDVEGVQKALSKMRGLGSFMSLQVACDYMWSPHSHLPNTSRVPIAVGSRLALEYMMSCDLEQSVPKLQCEKMYDWLYTYQRTPAGGPHMTYTDLEHALCEWGKYQRYEAGKVLSNFLPFKSGDIHG